MKQLALLLLLIATPLFSMEPEAPLPHRGDRVAVLASPVGAGATRVDARIRRALPDYLARALKSAGYDARVSPFTLTELEARSSGKDSRDDFVIEVMYADVEGENWGGVGTGGIIGSTGVGAEISVIEAHVETEIRVYDATSFDLIDSFVLQASAVAPAITGVGLGDRHGFLYLALPVLTPHPYRIAARRLAADAATRLGQRPE